MKEILNLIFVQLSYILQGKRLVIMEKLLQIREVTFSDDDLIVVEVDDLLIKEYGL